MAANKTSFKPGNQFWKARSSHGPKPKFTNGDDLLSACREYFQWIEDNPLWEDKLVTFQGIAKHEPVAKMRVATLTGLQLFLDVNDQTWRDWREKRADLAGAMEWAESCIRTQKFAGAAADLFNANFIARDLGLADRQEHTGKDGGAIQTEDKTPRELAQGLVFMLAKALKDGGGTTDG